MVSLDHGARSKPKWRVFWKLSLSSLSFLSVECRKDKVFCAICGKGLTVSKSQRRAQFGNISDIVSCFGFPTDTSRIDGVLFNSCRTALLKYLKTGKKSLHVSCDRLQTCNLCAWKLNKTLWDSSKCLSVYMVIIRTLAPPQPPVSRPVPLPWIIKCNVSDLPHPNPQCPDQIPSLRSATNTLPSPQVRTRVLPTL